MPGAFPRLPGVFGVAQFFEIFLARFPGVRVHVAMGGRAEQQERPFARVGLYGVGQAGAKPMLRCAPESALGGDEAFMVNVPMLAVAANALFFVDGPHDDLHIKKKAAGAA